MSAGPKPDLVTTDESPRPDYRSADRNSQRRYVASLHSLAVLSVHLVQQLDRMSHDARLSAHLNVALDEFRAKKHLQSFNHREVVVRKAD